MMGEKCKRLPNGDCHYDQCPADHVHSLRPVTKCCLGLAEPGSLPSSDKPSDGELVKMCARLRGYGPSWSMQSVDVAFIHSAADTIERLAASRLSVPREGEDEDPRQFLVTTTGDVHSAWIITGLGACIDLANVLVGSDGHDDMDDPDNWSGPDGAFFCWHRDYEDGSLTFQQITGPNDAAVATPSPATVDVGEARKMADDMDASAQAFVDVAKNGDTGWEGGLAQFAVPTAASAMIRSLVGALETSEKRATAIQGTADDMYAKLLAAEALAREAGKALAAVIDGYDKGSLQMASEEVGGEPSRSFDDPGVPAHPWHEEWLHYARETLAQLRPVTTEGK